MSPLTYVLPIRSDAAPDDELVGYVNDLASRYEVIVVDGSPELMFANAASRYSRHVRHVHPRRDMASSLNGKVSGVLTGLRLASFEHVVIADDDVRHDDATLSALAAALSDADVVRPQNYFDPLPWHAQLDTARMLINRVTGGDWPGTLAVRRSALARTGGYAGHVMFENLELVRTVIASGGRATVADAIYVRRFPPTTAHFFSQRVRQAYDEFARPARMALALAVLPLFVLVAWGAGFAVSVSLVSLSIIPAEIGRRRHQGRRVFPFLTALWAPLWILERGLCAWAALASRVTVGGVRYRGQVLKTAATSLDQLRRQHGRRETTEAVR